MAPRIAGSPGGDTHSIATPAQKVARDPRFAGADATSATDCRNINKSEAAPFGGRPLNC
jgi:hypothetical protein